MNNLPLDTTNLPTFDIKNRQGSTDYIDFIKPHEFDSSAVCGIDCFKRPFLTLKCVGSVMDENQNVSEKEFVQTFFQRYSDNTHLWMGAYAGAEEIIHTEGGMKKCQFDFLNELLKGETITDFNNNIRFNFRYTPQSLRLK